MSTVSLCMFLFGLVMICQGLVTNWGGLMTTRWFLGMFRGRWFGLGLTIEGRNVRDGHVSWL